MSDQGELFNLGIPDRAILGSGQARAFSGQVMEAVICSLFNLRPLPIDSSKAVCPDAETIGKRPCEIKSLKRGQKLVVYDWRAAKDHGETLYFVGCHKRPKSNRVADIWTGTADTLREVLIIPAPTVACLAMRYPLHKIKQTATASGKRNGYQRHGYADGYRSIPFAAIKEQCKPAPFTVKATVHGLAFEAQPWIAPEPCALILAEYRRIAESKPQDAPEESEDFSLQSDGG